MAEPPMPFGQRAATPIHRQSVGSLLDGLDFGRREASISAGPKFELDLLTLVETAEPSLLNGGNMNESVFGAIVRDDEAKTLGRVKPFYYSDRHVCLFLIASCHIARGNPRQRMLQMQSCNVRIRPSRRTPAPNDRQEETLKYLWFYPAHKTPPRITFP